MKNKITESKENAGVMWAVAEKMAEFVSSICILGLFYMPRSLWCLNFISYVKALLWIIMT